MSRRGYKRTEKTKRKISTKLTGRKLSEKTKEKLRKMSKGKHYSPETEFKKGQHPTEGAFKKGHIVSDETKRKMREARIKYMTSGKWKNKETYIEVKIENELKRQRIPYMKQVPLEGITIVDFLLPNRIVVQADGSYWHSKEKNKGKDIAQDTILGFRGYKIYRFAETEINKSAERCINKILGG